MEARYTLQSLAGELQRQSATKRDFVADTRRLTLATADDGGINLTLSLPQGDQIMGVQDTFHEQMGSNLGIPKTYYDRMRKEAPALLSSNCNHWLHTEPSNRMVRTLDNSARAFLSDKYRPLDNIDLVAAVVPHLGKLELAVKACELTPSRMYIKAVAPRVEGEVKKGDPVQAGIILSNSETGQGSLSVQPFLYRLICLNGAVMEDHVMRRIHSGTVQRGSDGAWELYRDDTKRQTDKAVFMQAADLISSFLKQDFFNSLLVKMQAAATEKIAGEIPKVIERIVDSYNLSEAEGQNVLKHLIEGGDITRWGMVNAITAAAKDSTDYDRLVDMEKLGGRVIELKNTEWAELAAA